MVDKDSEKESTWTKLKLALIYLSLYLSGILILLAIIADPFAMSTYFSDNSLLPGLANREFSLVTEAEYYLKALEKLSRQSKQGDQIYSFATLPQMTSFIKNELDLFGLEVYEQKFNYINSHGKREEGINIYSIIRGERSTNSESITLCAPYKDNGQTNTLSSLSLSMALAKYFSTKSYWAQDVIILFVDRGDVGLSVWLKSYYDVEFKQNLKRPITDETNTQYESLIERSGPMQAAIVLELTGRQFARTNIKLHGTHGQLPNLDLFNLVVELASRESVTPYFHNKSLPYGLHSDMDLYMSNLETAISFIKTQATMRADGLHGHFLEYAIQSLTIEGPEHDKSDHSVLLASLLNVGRLVEGVFRSLNNLTERFNRSFYFYIIVSLRRFTSIGYYMIALGTIISPLLLKAYHIHLKCCKQNRLFIGFRGATLLLSSLLLSLLSVVNISTALIGSIACVPILLAVA